MSLEYCSCQGYFIFTLCRPNSAYILCLDQSHAICTIHFLVRVFADHDYMDGVHGAMFIPILQVSECNGI